MIIINGRYPVEQLNYYIPDLGELVTIQNVNIKRVTFETLDI